ncbi:MAG: BREX-3 system P-loop-containing protein BrxF [Desulfovibrio piger]|jgi:hypothetical protein|uniref:BREX-3 system P-loop-containing protein BrxF n=1 Tax=Desulfovibrio piger TaxID=901 RepID=UPI0022E0FE72
MLEQVYSEVKNSLHSAESLYYRLVLLVGQSGTSKSKTLYKIAHELGIPVINANMIISGLLLELTSKQRALRLPSILNEICSNSNSLVILDNTEILFDSSLKQDPLRLLQSISRNRILLSSWNGRFLKNKLLYAEVGHHEFRSYENADALIIDMNSNTSIGEETKMCKAEQA